MKTSNTISLILLGAVVGFLAATRAPGLAIRPAHAAGTWACGVADKFPDVKAARAWHGAKDIEQGMNQLAPNATAGQVVGVNLKASLPHIVCVKN